MTFDELTKEEEIIIEAFNRLWNERDVSATGKFIPGQQCGFKPVLRALSLPWRIKAA